MGAVEKGGSRGGSGRRPRNRFDTAVGVTRRELSRLMPISPPSAGGAGASPRRRVERLVRRVMTTRSTDTP